MTSLKQPESIMSSLSGLWEQAGYLHPIDKTVTPWPAGSLNASVREFMWFGADGEMVFGRFGAGASVSFDESRRRFVTGGHIDAILTGHYKLDGLRLIEEWITAENQIEVRRVELAELNADSFVVKERAPGFDFALLVAYRRVQQKSPSRASCVKSAERTVHWQVATPADRVGDYYIAYKAVVKGASWLVAVNDFPAEMFYTLIVDGKEVNSFNEWPKDWARPD
jgi:hypothetical protein